LLWANGVMRILASDAEREGTPLIEVIRDPALLDSVESSIQSGEAQSVTTKSLLPGKFFQVTVAPMTGGGFVLVFHDITERGRVEKIRRDFIANVSHEMRTPVTAVQGDTQTVSDHISDIKIKEYLEIIQI